MSEKPTTDIAILLTTCNKYTPGVHKFRLQSALGLRENSTSTSTQMLSKVNLLNLDTAVLPISKAKSSSEVELELPKEVTLNYPTKFIPPGTRFIVSFTGGDITKPVIMGREF